MTNPFSGGVQKMDAEPVKLSLTIRPGDDLECFFPLAPGSEPWPVGTTAVLNFYTNSDEDAPVLLTTDLDVSPDLLYARMEYADLATLPDRSVVAVYTTKPTELDHLAGVGVAKKKDRS